MLSEPVGREREDWRGHVLAWLNGAFWDFLPFKNYCRNVGPCPEGTFGACLNFIAERQKLGRYPHVLKLAGVSR
jgi:hypothetical protein